MLATGAGQESLEDASIGSGPWIVYLLSCGWPYRYG